MNDTAALTFPGNQTVTGFNDVSLQCQERLIGCICSPDGTDAFARLFRLGLREEWFSDPRCAIAFTTAMHMFNEKEPIDNVTVSLRLQGTCKNYEEINGSSGWLDFCVLKAGSAAYAEWYLSEFTPYRQKREVENEATAALDAVKEGDAQEGVSALAEATRRTSEILGVGQESESLLEAIDAVFDASENPSLSEGLALWATPFMDRALGRISDELIFVAGRPGTGKTAFAVQLMVRNAHSQITTSLRSLESKRNKIIGRLRLNQDQNREKIKEIHEFLRISDRPATPSDIRAWCMIEKKSDSMIAIVDNMKHIRSEKKHDSTHDEFRQHSQALKHLRDDTNIPLLVLHHTNREGQLSWSDDIERDADIVIILEENEELTNSMSLAPHQKSVVNARIVKCREGTAGFKIPLIFDKINQKFSDIDEPAFPQPGQSQQWETGEF
jgi:replicative DNA helicase